MNGLLNDPKDRRFHYRWEAPLVALHLQRVADAKRREPVLEIPANGRHQPEVVERAGTKIEKQPSEVTQGDARLRLDAPNQVDTLWPDRTSSDAAGMLETVENDEHCGQILGDAVMELAGNPPPFILLR
jgi:hypothetical protein